MSRILGPTFFLLGLSCVLMGFWTAQRNEQIMSRGEVTKGTIVRHEIRLVKMKDEPGEVPQERHHLTYRYTIGGTPYTKEIPVSEKLYFRWSDGDAVDVRYLPEAPESGRIEGQANEGTLMMVVGGGFGIAGLVLSYFTLFHRRAVPETKQERAEPVRSRSNPRRM